MFLFKNLITRGTTQFKKKKTQHNNKPVKNNGNVKF
jgi:hypothetical protein